MSLFKNPKVAWLMPTLIWLLPLQLPGADVAPASTEASKLISAAVSVRRFEGAPVVDMLLTDPEKKAGTYRYRGEFSVAKTGKKILCEDWAFSVERKNGGWDVIDIVRGRCND